MNRTIQFTGFLTFLSFFGAFSLEARPNNRGSKIITEIKEVEKIVEKPSQPINYFFILPKNDIQEVVPKSIEQSQAPIAPHTETTQKVEEQPTIEKFLQDLTEQKALSQEPTVEKRTFRALVKNQAEALLKKANNHKKKVVALGIVIGGTTYILKSNPTITLPSYLAAYFSSFVGEFFTWGLFPINYAIRPESNF